VAAFDPGRTAAWLALAVALALLSLDDIVALHERMGGVADALGLWDHANRAVGLILLAPVLAAALALACWLSRPAEAEVRRRVDMGMVLLAVAVLFEAAGSQLIRNAGWSGAEPPYLAEVLVEEGMELAGWILLGSRLAAIACATLVTIGDPGDPVS
jgi:hypothetical protein